MIRGTISHDRDDESPLAKAHWFQSLSIEERLDVFESFAELADEQGNGRGNILDEVAARYAHTPPERIQVIERP